MARRPISPRLHGILDYATGAQLLALPALLGIEGSRTAKVLRAVGAAHLVGSALTKTEVGVVKVLPLRLHLVGDALGAVGLAASPWLLGTKDDGLRHWLPQVIVAAGDTLVAALTDPGAAAGAEAGPGQSAAATAAAKAGEDVELSKPDPSAAVMPDGVEANDGIGARTIGIDGGRGARTSGGMGSGTGPGSDPAVGGQME